MGGRIKILLRAIERDARAILTIGIVGVLIVAMLTAGGLYAANQTLESVPELPEPSIDVSQIEDLDEAVNRTASQASVVVDRNGDVVGRFAPEELHVPFAVGQVPQIVEGVLLAAEDENFRDHEGYSPEAIARAFARNATSGDIEQGGSTITQQLAKLLFIGDDNSLERKLEELQVAIDLEDHFSKDEILTAYANSVFLGNGAFGFEAAARTYFDKSAADLTLSEAALLVGILPAPTPRNPRTNPEAADAARRSVLQRVADAGFAAGDEMRAAVAEVPKVQPRKPRAEGDPYYLDYVRRYLLDHKQVDPDLLYGGGLTIETGLDPDLQAVARWSVATHLPDGGPDGALAVVDVRNGMVVALVGGRNFEEAEVNLALGRLGAGSGRQAGSSFKPFVLAAAFERGVVPEQTIGAPQTYLPTSVDDPKPVHNFTNRGHGTPTVAEATIQSINTAFVALTEAVGAGAVRDTAEKLGIGGLPDHVGPSIGIGAYETSPLEMASAYGAFATEGHLIDSGPVRRLLTPGGDVLADFSPRAPEARPRVLGQNAARQINAILAENVRRGTATRGQFGWPAAAKTGTSNDYQNAWLVGHTPVFATAVWVGHPEGNIEMRNVAGFRTVTGGSLPALIWKDVMAAAHQGMEPVEFFPPSPTTATAGALPGGSEPPRPPADEAEADQQAMAGDARG